MALLTNLIFRAYWKAESLIVPGLRSSQYCYYEKLRPLVPGKVWLDLGCGHQVFTDWMTKEQQEVTSAAKTVYGIDLDWAGLRGHPRISNKVFGDLASLPFASDSMDLVTANMVIEHLATPETVLNEIRRVLKPGGILLFHTPNKSGWTTRVGGSMPESLKKPLIWFFERRGAEDVFPTYHRLNSETDIRKLAERTKFDVEDVTMVSTSAATAMLGPVAWAELLYIRRLQNPKRAKFRSNIVARLRKRD